MRMGAALLVLIAFAQPVAAQVINGESTADSAYAKSPPAAWSPPSGEPDAPAVYPQDDRNARPGDNRRDRD